MLFMLHSSLLGIIDGIIFEVQHWHKLRLWEW